MISKRFEKRDSKSFLKLNNIQLAAKKQFEENVLNGKYKFESISCPICNSIKTELLAEKDRYGLDYNVVVCTVCGLVYINPRMDQESYNNYYDNEYRKLYVGVESPTNLFFFNQYRRSKQIFAFIESAFTKMNFKDLNVLEIGCAAGGILYYFKEQGCNVKGFDLGSEYLQYGKNNYDLDLSHGSLQDIPENYKPDIIIYSHVMEHILDLNSELKKLREICHEKTILYIEVPGIRNIHNSYLDLLFYFQNAHTFNFTLSSLINLFTKNGFKFIKGTEHVRSVFVIDQKPMKRDEINNEYPKIVNYIKNIERYRFLLILKKKIHLIIVFFRGKISSLNSKKTVEKKY